MIHKSLKYHRATRRRPAGGSNFRYKPILREAEPGRAATSFGREDRLDNRLVIATSFAIAIKAITVAVSIPTTSSRV
jgi:hypothetical protein